jgi:nucleoside phosphorylase
MAKRPASREEFHVAIVCASTSEFDAISSLIDEFWDEDGFSYGKAQGDNNSYSTGRIGKHNVVMVLLPSMGKVNAAMAAAHLQISYRQIRLALLVGICGAVPYTEAHEEILLGDVIISTSIIQYDLGKQYPDGFVSRASDKDEVIRPQRKIRDLISQCQSHAEQARLISLTSSFLRDIQNSSSTQKSQYPGATRDKLFRASYIHKHQILPDCLCASNHGESDIVCDESRRLACEQLGCDDKSLILRERLRQLENDNTQEHYPRIFFGRFGCADTIIKSGKQRDALAAQHNVIAFDMESAGLWEQLPSIVIRGVSDYADSHRNKVWQPFAAITAACTMKALLEIFVDTDRDAPQTQSLPYQGDSRKYVIAIKMRMLLHQFD